jgi:hypothetical protein
MEQLLRNPRKARLPEQLIRGRWTSEKMTNKRTLLLWAMLPFIVPLLLLLASRSAMQRTLVNALPGATVVEAHFSIIGTTTYDHPHWRVTFRYNGVQTLRYFGIWGHCTSGLAE